jgi:hypothetical protein
VVAGITAVVVYYLIPKKIEYKEKIVTQVQTRERVRTKIIERPNGDKVTLIDSQVDTDLKQVSEKQSKPSLKDYRIGLYGSIPIGVGEDTIYTLTVDYRLFMSVYGGVYIRSDKEIGVGLSIPL